MSINTDRVPLEPRPHHYESFYKNPPGPSRLKFLLKGKYYQTIAKDLTKKIFPPLLKSHYQKYAKAFDIPNLYKGLSSKTIVVEDSSYLITLNVNNGFKNIAITDLATKDKTTFGIHEDVDNPAFYPIEGPDMIQVKTRDLITWMNDFQKSHSGSSFVDYLSDRQDEPRSLLKT